MANTVFKLRRSSVGGKVPNTDVLSIGELAINLTDRKLFSSDGTNIFETGSNLTSLSVFSNINIGNSTVNTVINSTSLSVKSIIANGSVGSANQILHSNGSGLYWANAVAAGAARTYSVTTVSGTQNTFSTPGNFVSGSTDVYLNGVHLSNSDYTEISSNSIQLTVDASNGSVVDVSGWVTINTLVAGSNTTIQFNDSGYINSSPTFTWNKSSNTLTVGNSTVNTAINSTSFSGTANAAKFLTGNTTTNTFTVGTSAYFVSNGNLGIGNTSPTTKLSVNGTTYLQNTVTLNGGLTANGSMGTAKDVLYSNGSATYWAAPLKIFDTANAQLFP